MLRKVLVGVAVAAAVPSVSLAAEPGSPDTTFGTGGRAFAGLNRAQLGHRAVIPEPAALVRTPGGRLVVAGRFFSQKPSGLFLAAFTSRGKPAGSFGKHGVVLTGIGAPTEISSMVRQPDGRLVVGGTTGVDYGLTGVSSGTMLVARYTPGRLDRSFGDDGVVRLSLGPGPDALNALRPRAGGRILAAGSTGARGALIELDRNGRLHRAFGRSGKVILNLGSGRERLTGVAIDRHHRILVSGTRAGTGFVVRLMRGARSTGHSAQTQWQACLRRQARRWPSTLAAECG